MEKPNKDVLDVAQYLLNNASNIDHVVCISVDKKMNTSIRQSGNIPNPLYAFMASFFSHTATKTLFGHVEPLTTVPEAVSETKEAITPEIVVQ